MGRRQQQKQQQRLCSRVCVGGGQGGGRWVRMRVRWTEPRIFARLCASVEEEK